MSIYSGPNPNLRNRPNGVPNLAVPEGSPSLFIDFVNNNCATVNNGIKTASSNAMSLITFTRSSNATYTAANGTIQYVANNISRFDYDAVTGYCKGLLIEEQRTNLFLNSTSIAMSGSTQSYVTAPDGTLTAIKSVPDGIATYHMNNNQLMTVSANTVYTASFYMKSFGYTGFQFQLRDNGYLNNYVVANINLATKTVVAGVSGDYSLPSTSITFVGNEWYRITLTGKTNASTIAALNFYQGHTDGNDISLAGDGVSGSAVWGLQLEAGTFATSYIPTGGSTATRLADSASITGANFSSWYTQSQGTFLLSFARTPATNGNYSRLLPINGGAGTDFMELDAFSSTLVGIYGQGITFFGPSFSNINTLNGSTVNAATSYTSNIMKISANGAAPQSTPYGVTSVATSISLGSPTGNFYNGYIKQLTFFPTFLSNASLQQITS